MELNCEIIAVGTELLLGNITNTNARFLSEELASAGVNVLYHSVVGDNQKRLTEVFNYALQRANVVILTGGLGPTQDDLTKETVFSSLGLQSEFNESCYNKIVDYFKAKGKQCPDNNKKQAYFPKEAIICPNECGTAPGCIIPLENKTVVILPGPPSELEPMFLKSVKPYLANLSGSIIFSKTIKLFGIGESEAAEMVADLLTGSNPTAAFYAKTGRVDIRVTAKGESQNQAELLVLSLVHKLNDVLSEYVYGYDDDTLESVAVELLKKAGKTLATAESITGGLISKRITDVPGASQVFSMGFCTYSDEAKMKLLKVNKKTLKFATAISEETARLMAEGATKQAQADFGLATTGLAGPTSDESGKPVGTVYIAVSYKDNTIAKKLFINRGLENDRDYIREITSLNALSLLIKAINQYCFNDNGEEIISDSLLPSSTPVNSNVSEEDTDESETKIDAFMAALNERKIDVDTNTQDNTDTNTTKDETNPITQVLSQSSSSSDEQTSNADNTDESEIEALNPNAKKSYNFELFE